MDSIRNFTCWQCKYRKIATGNKPEPITKPVKCYCDKTKRIGSLKRGYNCNYFEYRQLHNEICCNGIPYRNRQPLDYRTARQWEEAGRRIKDNAIGKIMYANKHSTKTYSYYLIDETEKFI